MDFDLYSTVKFQLLFTKNSLPLCSSEPHIFLVPFDFAMADSAQMVVMFNSNPKQSTILGPLCEIL